jgi:hypothetical protein
MKRIISFALFLMSVSFFSCKPSDNVTPPQGPYATLDAALGSVANPPKVYNLNASTGGSFFGTDGSRFIFYAGSIKSVTDTIVTGTVQVQLREFLGKGDMIFSGVLPISNGDPIRTAGAVNVNIVQNGIQLKTRLQGSYQVNIPEINAHTTGMKVFRGYAISNYSNGVNWQIATDTGFSGGAGLSYISGGDSISIFNDSLGYCSASKAIDTPNYQFVTVNVTSLAIPSGTRIYAYAVFANSKGIWQLTNISGTTVTDAHIPAVPVYFVAMTVVNGNFYGGVTPAFTPSTGASYAVNLNKTDPITFKTLLNGLQ